MTNAGGTCSPGSGILGGLAWRFVQFGPGHRRPDGPPGTRGVTGQVIHQDGRGTIAELAFSPGAMIAPHTNPNTTYFVVVSGGGFVQVADERARVGHGEAVVWPAGVLHGAWTEGTEMRALVVEFSGPDDAIGELGGGDAGRACCTGPPAGSGTPGCGRARSRVAGRAAGAAVAGPGRVQRGALVARGYRAARQDATPASLRTRPRAGPPRR